MAERRVQAYGTSRGMATEEAIAEVVEAMAGRTTALRFGPGPIG